MRDFRCNCEHGHAKLAEYDDKKVVIRCKKCKKDHLLKVIDNKLQEVKDGDMEVIHSSLNKKRESFGTFKYLMEHPNDIIK